ncbi:MAG: hypothetical protein ACRCYU_14875 [Nocardioides sp.]
MKDDAERGPMSGEVDGLEITPDNDLSVVLTRLMEHSEAKTYATKWRTANSRMVRAYMDAGLELVTQQFQETVDVPAEDEQPASVFFSWLKWSMVWEEAQRRASANGSDSSEADNLKDSDSNKVRRRWGNKEGYVDRYIHDLLAYAMWTQHLQPGIERARQARLDLADVEDVPLMVQDAANAEIDYALHNPYQYVALVAAAISGRYPHLRDLMGRGYKLLLDQWIPVYKELLARHGLKLRDGITYQEFADMLSSMGEGIVLRAQSDAEAREEARTSFGKAALVIVLGCCTTIEDDADFDEAVQELFAKRAPS